MRNRTTLLSQLTRAAIALMIGIVGLAAHAQSSVLTQHYDNARSGADTTETQLTPANVNANNFGELFTCGLDASVNGQVLYVPSVTIGGVVHNVIYTYTSENGGNSSPSSLYAFDADNGTQLWRHQLTPGAEWMTCSPVIDPSTNTIYIVTKDNTDTGNTNLRALDITTGDEKTGSPIVIAATVPGTGDGSSGGMLAFNTAQQNSRPGLLLLNGNVYFSTSNTIDSAPWHGWLFGYHYDGTRFTQTGVFCSTPNGGGGGIWMGGSGIAADSAGHIYVATGNGTFDADTGGSDYAMSYVKLSTPGLSVLDWYSPHDEASQSIQDLDLAGGGVATIPGTDLLFGGFSKFGSIFLVDTTNMGHFNAATDTAVQRLDGLAPINAFTSPVVWNNGTDTYVYLWAVGANLLQFQFVPSAGLFSPAGVYKQVDGNPSGGGMVLSSNGTSNAIVWAVGEDDVVRAFNATDVSEPELWDSNENSGRDGLPNIHVHLSFPMLANGKLYVPFVGGIAVYGLLDGGNPPATPGNLTAAPGNAQASLTWIPSATATSYNIYMGTTSGGELPKPVAMGVSGTSCNVTGLANRLKYYFEVTGVDVSGESAKSTEANATPVLPPPAAPTGLTASVTQSRQITIAWSNAGDSTSFNVYRGTSAGGEASTPIATGVAGKTFVDSGLTVGITYYYVVAGVNLGGTSAPSNEANAKAILTALHSFAAGLQMISAPVDDSSEAFSSIFDQTGVSLMSWVPSSYAYAVTPNAPADTLKPCYGYWVNFAAATDVMDLGTETTSTQGYSVPLTVGWNMVGNPRSTSVSASTVSIVAGSQTYKFDAAVEADVIYSGMYTYGPSSTAYQEIGGSSAVFQPFAGYWILRTQTVHNYVSRYL